MHLMYLQLMTCCRIGGCLIHKYFMCFYIPATSLKGDRANTVELKIDFLNCVICTTDKNYMISNLKFEHFYDQNRQN